MSSDNILPNIKSFSGGGNFFDNLFSDVANYTVQTSTGGLLGYQDGKIGNGVTTNYYREVGRGLRDGVKDITGATAAEEANAQARAQYEQARRDAEAARVEQQNRIAQSEIAKSRSAQRSRSTQNRSRTSGGYGSFSISQDEQDFLGL